MVFPPDGLRLRQEEAIAQSLIAAFRANPGSCQAFGNAMEVISDLDRKKDATILHETYAPKHNKDCRVTRVIFEASPSEV